MVYLASISNFVPTFDAAGVGVERSLSVANGAEWAAYLDNEEPLWMKKTEKESKVRNNLF